MKNRPVFLDFAEAKTEVNQKGESGQVLFPPTDSSV